MKMSVAKNIKALRNKKSLSQRELGEKIGVSQNTISGWEGERNEPTIYNCVLLADYFGVTLDELCRGEIKCNLFR